MPKRLIDTPLQCSVFSKRFGSSFGIETQAFASLHPGFQTTYEDLRPMSDSLSSDNVSLPLEVLRRIADACTRFDQAVRAGMNPRIENHIPADGPPQDRRELLKALLEIEFSYRQKAGESFHFHEYLQRFPHNAEVVHSAFPGRATVDDSGVHASTAGTCPPATDGPAPSLAKQSKPVQRESWGAGQLILRDFIIECELGEGGMGKVYQVRSQSTGQRFAVKRTKVGDPASQRRFLAELQTWIDLPEHPHLTACRFFRTMNDEVTIFAEHVEGGSLASRIRARSLTRLDEMLNMAIQCAWGLHAIHEHGVVHQDFKPGNVLLSKPPGDSVAKKIDMAIPEAPSKYMVHYWSVAKVTDFGLARARKVTGETGGAPGQSILVSAGGMTPAYCSPEQERGDPLSRRTDIWSWGVSVLEMFIGKVSWRSGTDAPEVLEDYLASGGKSIGFSGMPKGLVEVLRGCFQRNAAERWSNLALVAEALQWIYSRALGQAHPRTFLERPIRNDCRVVAHDPPGVLWWCLDRAA
jgi:hypothetical protein